MFSWLMKVVAACWRPVRQYARMNEDEGGHNDELLWYKDICQHACGEFSFAVVQANALVEDQSQVETGPHGTFVGIYDGHGGPEASRFVSDHLFLHLMRFAREEGRMSDEVLRRSFNATEEGFLAHVTRSWKTKPLIAAVGSCCLVGVIWGEKLFVANVGDSRAVMGSLGRSNKKITAEQLTRDHNASVEEVRQELKALHPDDSRIVVNKHGVWRVKGIIQVSRSIGDVYLKKPEFNLGPVYTRFQLSEPLHRPVLTADPSIYTLTLNPQDKFLIFASDGLWEHLTNQQAVEIVYNYPRAVTEPLVRVLRMVDGEGMPMGFIYEAMDRAKEAISHYYRGNTRKCEILWRIIDRRWTNQLHQPIHAFAYFLNPKFYFSDSFGADEDVMAGVITCIDKMTPDPELRDKVLDELEGIARRLVRAALQEAAKKREMRYSDLKKIERGIRRHFHDDISVVVIFLDHELIGKNSNTPPLSVKGGIDVVVPSDFSVLDGLDVNHNLVP